MKPTRRVGAILALVAALALPLGSVKAATSGVTESLTITDPVHFVVSVSTINYGSQISGVADAVAPQFTVDAMNAVGGHSLWLQVNATGTNKIQPTWRQCKVAGAGYTKPSGTGCEGASLMDWQGGTTDTKLLSITTPTLTPKTSTWDLAVKNAGANARSVASYTGSLTITLALSS